jgi:hypothetical protein
VLSTRQIYFATNNMMKQQKDVNTDGKKVNKFYMQKFLTTEKKSKMDVP